MNLETKLHEGLWEAVRINYEKRNFTGAILDAFYFLSDLIRKKGGIEGDGAALVGNAFGGASPKIKLNKLQSESEWNVQRGIEQLLRGFYQAVRNPRSHNKHADSQDDASRIILFIDFLIRKIDVAKSQFSRDDFLKRVIDPDFVAKKRYAELLIAEIPPGQRMEVFLDVYRAKEEGGIESLRLFFAELLQQLTEDELAQVVDVISQELKTAEDEATIRTNISSFNGDLWPRIDEVVRLRIENKLIRSIQSGEYNRQKAVCRAGALGTWSTRLFKHFGLKEELLSVIDAKLAFGTSDEQEYLYKYIFPDITDLQETIPFNLSLSFEFQLDSQDKRLFEILKIYKPWKKSWPKSLTKSFNEFKSPVTDEIEDDIPF